MVYFIQRGVYDRFFIGNGSFIPAKIIGVTVHGLSVFFYFKTPFFMHWYDSRNDIYAMRDLKRV